MESPLEYQYDKGQTKSSHHTNIGHDSGNAEELLVSAQEFLFYYGFCPQVVLKIAWDCPNRSCSGLSVPRISCPEVCFGMPSFEMCQHH